MSRLEEVAADSFRDSEWRRHIPWSLDSEASVRIREAELIALVDEWLGLAMETTPREPGDLANAWLSSLQRLLGCQGIGLFFPEGDEWRAALKLGGRSLGKPSADWLKEAVTSGLPQGRLDYPAEGWGQLVFPFSCELVSTQAGALVISARHPEVLDLDALEELLPLLARVSQFVTETRAANQTAKQQTLEQQCINRLLTATTPSELMDRFQETLQQQTPAASYRFLLVPPESTAVYQIDNEQLLSSLQNVSSGDVIGCFHTQQGDLATEMFSKLADHETHSLPPSLAAVPFPETIGWRGGCLVWSVAENESASNLLLPENLRPLVAAWSERWAELQRQGSRSNHAGLTLLAVDEIAEQYCETALTASDSLLRNSEGPVFLAGEPGLPLSIAVQYLLQRNECLNSALFLDCQVVSENRFRESLQQLIQPVGQNPIAIDQYADHQGQQVLVLHEVGALPLPAQQELLAVLRESAQRRSLRLITTASSDLRQLVEAGEFLDALMLQLGTVRLHLPPLRSQPELSVVLFHHLLQQTDAEIQLDDEAKTFLREYQWPGNLDELRESARKLMRSRQAQTGNAPSLVTRFEVQAALEQESVSPDELVSGLAEATLEFQRLHIRRAIAQSGGNMTEAARRLDLHRSNLYRKMNQLNMAEAGTNPGEE